MMRKNPELVRLKSRFNLDFDQGSMHLSDPVLKDLRYGFDEEFLYLRLDTDGNILERTAGCTLVVEIVEPVKRTFRLKVEGPSLLPLDDQDDTAGIRGAVERVAEVGLPLRELEVLPGGEILLSFSLWKGGDPMEKAPLFSLVKIKVPEDYELEYWIV